MIDEPVYLIKPMEGYDMNTGKKMIYCKCGLDDGNLHLWYDEDGTIYHYIYEKY